MREEEEKKAATAAAPLHSRYKMDFQEMGVLGRSLFLTSFPFFMGCMPLTLDLACLQRWLWDRGAGTKQHGWHALCCEEDESVR
jgi:hypothetical protein